MRATLLTGSAGLLFKLAAAQCKTVTTTQVGIATTVSDLSAFQSSMDAKYSKTGGDITNTVFIHTSVYTYPGGSFTGYGIYESDALASEGFNFVTQTVTETSCEPTEPPETDEPSETLPPSPTGSICSPHGDHWHCHPSPTGTGTTAAETSSSSSSDPDDDDDDETPASTATCTPHHDHWHCPPGVPSPTYAPSDAPSPSTLTRAPATTTAATNGSSSPSSTSGGDAPAESAVSTAGAAGKPHAQSVALSVVLGLGIFVYGLL